MLNHNLTEHWEMPLHQQWQALPVSEANDSLNYSSGNALGFIHLRGLPDDNAFRLAVRAVLGADVPTTPKQLVYGGQAAVMWLSPDEWLVLCPYAAKAALLADLQAALAGIFAQVVDNSGGFMMLRIHGRHAETVLRHLTPYDVASLEAGQCVQTVMKKTTVVINKVADNDFALVFRRSFADYLWRVLQKTARPYGYALQKNWQFDHPDWQRYTA